MATTKDIGKYYWHGLTYPIKPKCFWEKAETQEIDEPFRSGKGIAIRMPLTRRAIVIGKWSHTDYTESQALTYAIRGRGLKKEEVNWDAIRQGVKEGS